MSAQERLEFARVYEAHHAKVLGYVARLIGPDEAEDVVQEIFVKIDRSLESLADPAKITPWVYAVALNTVRDVIRRRASRPDRSPVDPDAERGSEDEEGAALDRIPDSRSRTPEETAIRNEMIACYLDYVSRLSPTYLEVYLLGEVEDLPVEEVARRLSISVGTAKIRLHRARQQVHEQLRCGCRPYYNERGELMGEPKDRES